MSVLKIKSGNSWVPIPTIQGEQGEDGEPGYTPVKGVDYWTASDKAEIVADVEVTTETVSGTNVSITGVANTRYMCGEVSTISITPPQSGIINVVFTSGSSVAILTLPNTVKMPEWFEVEPNRIYEISIMDATYGVVMSWAT